MSGEKAETRSLIDKVLDLNPRVIFLLLLIVLVVPNEQPVGFPIAVSSYTNDLFNSLERLEPGSKVLFWTDMGWGWWPSEYRPAVVACVEHLVSRGIKFIVISGTADDPLIWDMALKTLINLKNYKYGVDYVLLGYYPGGEAAKANFAKDIRSMVKTDYLENKPIDQFPIMSGVTNAKAFGVVIEVSATPAEILLRQFYTAYAVPCAFLGSAGMFSDYLPYYSSRQIVGFTAGLSGGAQYEYLTRRPRWGIAALDALSTSHVLMVILLLVSNGLYLGKKWRA